MKADWNPDDIYHSVCAFANDFDNIGGGYIVIGVEERNGVAIRPVKGLKEEELDQIQKEILGYNNTMIPAYFPKIMIETLGSPEQRYISNVALMMFCEKLDKFFPYIQVEVIKFPEGSIKNPNNFKEFPVIKGSVPMIIKRTMQTIPDFLKEKRAEEE